MTQITSGIRAILSHPKVYMAVQNLMGAQKAQRRFVNEFIKPFPGMRILDIGCGPADILNHLTNVDYYGFDISEPYIKHAKAKFHDKGNFYCQELCLSDFEELPPFDVVLAIGLLHHLDDPIAINVLNLAAKALKPNGRLLTLDPCLEPRQNPVARFLIKQDRGRNVRNSKEYSKLASTIFDSFRIEIRHQSWIPYTHCFIECTAP